MSRLCTSSGIGTQAPLATVYVHTCILRMCPAAGIRPNIVQVLRDRGLIQEVTNPELEAVTAQESVSVYCGFDPTADSLHLGNLLGIIVLRWFAVCGHRPVGLLGGATGRVGDPSGQWMLVVMNVSHAVM